MGCEDIDIDIERFIGSLNAGDKVPVNMYLTLC